MTELNPQHQPTAFLRALMDAAVKAADPAHCVPNALAKDAPAGRILVLGAGKASASMAKALEDHAATHWPAADLSGIVVTRYGCEVPCDTIEIIGAAHPVPDAPGLAAAQRIMALATSATADDLVIYLISGGGSSLLTLPTPPLSLADKQAVNTALLRSGATISEMNCLRKHLSAIKGGRLAAAAAPARQLTLAISDVPGDDLAVIASGPTVPDPTTFEDARSIVRKYKLALPETVQALLLAGENESPKPGDPAFDRAEFTLIAKPQTSLEAAAEVARQAGCDVKILGDALEGEARDVGRDHAQLALQHRNTALARPLVLISGGETTVTLKGSGRGGRNSEYLLAFAIETAGAPGIHGIACDTDGIDGSEDNAGAECDPETLARGSTAGVDAADRLADNDAYGFFDAIGGLVMTGPTLTNVNDFRVALILPQ